MEHPARVPSQLKTSNKLLLLTSVHYDPLYGMTSAASDVVSLVTRVEGTSLQEIVGGIPCLPTKSNASWYSTRVLQSCPQVKVIEIIEKTTTGLLAVFYGECEPAHSESVEFWTKTFQ